MYGMFAYKYADPSNSNPIKLKIYTIRIKRKVLGIEIFYTTKKAPYYYEVFYFVNV